MNLKDKAKKLPPSPGVYLMKDSNGGIIYVGKSKNLKNRVQSYLLNSKNHSPKVEKLVKHLKDFDYVQTDTEFEAFMLECKLIKQLKPIYNKLMKSPQAYTYILIKTDKELHHLELAKEINENEKNPYFGPYSGRRAVENAIKGIKELFKLDCSNPSNNNTPCLNHSLGLCMGMCFKSSAVEQNNQIINRITALLEGTDTSILKELEQIMLDASGNFDFERAAKARDCINAVKSLLKKEKVIEFTKENKFIVVMEFINVSNLKLFLINGNKVLFNDMYQIDSTTINQLGQWLKSNILTYFKMNNHPSNSDISKEEIDEAQIIYSYLKSNACDYTIIPEKWLLSNNCYYIDKTIDEFLKSILKERLHLVY
jgi:excinuclease ABC subunit C